MEKETFDNICCFQIQEQQFFKKKFCPFFSIFYSLIQTVMLVVLSDFIASKFMISINCMYSGNIEKLTLFLIVAVKSMCEGG